MNIGGFIAFLIGLAFGGVIGLVCGLWVADEHWKNKVCPYCDHEYEEYKSRKQLRDSYGTER